MIDQLTIKNFQSHKSNILELCNGVNVIVGDSDSGKSAIVRALYWLIFNKPNGDSFMRHNVKNPTVVEVQGDFGCIRRVKGQGENYYTHNEEIYKAFGQGVPMPVSTALNMGELNFMRQLDPPFMFSKTGGELAQFLNKLINLDIIDSSLGKIKSQVTAARRQCDNTEQNIDRLIKSLDNFNELDDFDNAVAELEKLQGKLDKLVAITNQLIKLLRKYDDAEELVQHYAWVNKASRALNEVEASCSRLNELGQKQNRVKRAVSAFEKSNMTCNSYKGLNALRGAFTALLGDFEQYQLLNYGIMSIDTVKAAIQDCRDTIKQYDNTTKRLVDLEHEFERIKPDICPTCGQKWV